MAYKKPGYRLTQNMDVRRIVGAGLKANNGHCPCDLISTPVNICPCKRYQDQNDGLPCKCGLFVPIDWNENC